MKNKIKIMFKNADYVFFSRNDEITSLLVIQFILASSIIKSCSVFLYKHIYMNKYIPNTIHQCKDGAGGFQVALINLWCQHKNGGECFIEQKGHN